MKTKFQMIVLFLLSSYSFMAQENQNSYATSFFDSQMKILKSVEYENQLLCPLSKLDSILQSDTYHIVNYHKLPYLKNDSALVVFIRNDKAMDELEEMPKAPCPYNIYVIFQKKERGLYFLIDYFYLPLNQGIMALDFTKMSVENGKLYLRQYGGNRFGTWGTEMEFENSEHGWLLYNSKLFTTIDNLDYQMSKLIWSKKQTNKIHIDKVCFSDIFAPQELEWVMDGAYSE